MRLFAAAIISSVPLAISTYLPKLQSIFVNPSTASPHHGSGFRIPTVHESAVQARRILHLEDIGTLSTIFPSSSPSSSSHPLENRPSDVEGAPMGLMDYFGDCEPSTGNPTILAINIATSFKNVAAGSNITLSLRWHPPNVDKRRYSAANLPRYSVVGYLEDIQNKEVEEQDIARCFIKYHPDAKAWLPGNKIHESRWTRLVVQEVYWIGGFGDRAYIGWIPTQDWRNVTTEEVEKCRLPGEEDSFPFFSHLWL